MTVILYKSLNYLMQSDSDATLDNAKHEVEFCIKQMAELTPEIMEIARRELTICPN